MAIDPRYLNWLAQQVITPTQQDPLGLGGGGGGGFNPPDVGSSVFGGSMVSPYAHMGSFYNPSYPYGIGAGNVLVPDWGHDPRLLPGAQNIAYQPGQMDPSLPPPADLSGEFTTAPGPPPGFELGPGGMYPQGYFPPTNETVAPIDPGLYYQSAGANVPTQENVAPFDPGLYAGAGPGANIPTGEDLVPADAPDAYRGQGGNIADTSFAGSDIWNAGMPPNPFAGILDPTQTAYDPLAQLPPGPIGSVPMGGTQPGAPDYSGYPTAFFDPNVGFTGGPADTAAPQAIGFGTPYYGGPVPGWGVNPFVGGAFASSPGGIGFGGIPGQTSGINWSPMGFARYGRVPVGGAFSQAVRAQTGPSGTYRPGAFAINYANWPGWAPAGVEYAPEGGPGYQGKAGGGGRTQ